MGPNICCLVTIVDQGPQLRSIGKTKVSLGLSKTWWKAFFIKLILWWAIKEFLVSLCVFLLGKKQNWCAPQYQLVHNVASNLQSPPKFGNPKTSKVLQLQIYMHYECKTKWHHLGTMVEIFGMLHPHFHKKNIYGPKAWIVQ